MPGYRISTPAKRDFAQILEYQLENSGALIALDTEASFRTAFHSLVRNPGLGHLRQDLTSKAAFFFAVGRYLVVYRKEGDTVVVFAILHTSRDIKAVLQQRPF